MKEYTIEIIKGLDLRDINLGDTYLADVVYVAKYKTLTLRIGKAEDGPRKRYNRCTCDINVGDVLIISVPEDGSTPDSRIDTTKLIDTFESVLERYNITNVIYNMPTKVVNETDITGISVNTRIYIEDAYVIDNLAAIEMTDIPEDIKACIITTHIPEENVGIPHGITIRTLCVKDADALCSLKHDDDDTTSGMFLLCK